MEERILGILESIADPDHSHRYSLTIYQIAIEFAKRHESDFVKMGRPLGGTGAGKRALTIYMANQLSKRIKADRIERIEMQFLHPADTESMIYKYKDQQIVATTPAAGYPVPVYRLRQGRNGGAERAEIRAGRASDRLPGVSRRRSRSRAPSEHVEDRAIATAGPIAARPDPAAFTCPPVGDRSGGSRADRCGRGGTVGEAGR